MHTYITSISCKHSGCRYNEGECGQGVGEGSEAGRVG